MDDRDQEVAKIKLRMKELGHNQRSLSMLLFKKPDRLRNLFEGKSNNMRADTYKSVMEFLWPERNALKQEADLGLFSAIQGLISALYFSQALNKEKLEIVLNAYLRDFRMHNQSGAAGVMDRLLDFLHSGLSEIKSPKSQQSPQPAGDQLKTEKKLGN